MPPLLALIGFDVHFPSTALCWIIGVVAIATILVVPVLLIYKAADQNRAFRGSGILLLALADLGILLLDYSPTSSTASWFGALALEAASGVAGVGALAGTVAASIAGVSHGVVALGRWRDAHAERTAAEAQRSAAEAKRNQQAFLLGRDAGAAEFSALQTRRREIDSALHRANEMSGRLERNLRELGDTKAAPQFKKRLDQVHHVRDGLVGYRSRLDESLADLVAKQAAFGIVREVKRRAKRKQHVSVDDLKGLINMASEHALDPLRSEENVWKCQRSREGVHAPIVRAHAALRDYLAAVELGSLGLPAEMSTLDDALLDAAARDELDEMLGTQWRALDDDLQHLECEAEAALEVEEFQGK